jgi:hypothetical protein
MAHSHSANSQKALERYERNKAGESIADIAKADGVSENSVQQSIRSVQLFRSKHTHEYANQAISAIVIDTAGHVKKSLVNGLTATTTETISDKNGNTRKVKKPDVSAQMRAVSEYQKLASTIQPKGGGTNVNVGVGVGVNQTRVATGSYIGMEDRLRKIMQQQKQQPIVEGTTLTQATLELPSGEFEQDEPAENSV